MIHKEQNAANIFTKVETIDSSLNNTMIHKEQHAGNIFTKVKAIDTSISNLLQKQHTIDDLIFKPQEDVEKKHAQYNSGAKKRQSKAIFEEQGKMTESIIIDFNQEKPMIYDLTESTIKTCLKGQICLMARNVTLNDKAKVPQKYTYDLYSTCENNLYFFHLIKANSDAMISGMIKGNSDAMISGMIKGNSNLVISLRPIQTVNEQKKIYILEDVKTKDAYYILRIVNEVVTGLGAIQFCYKFCGPLMKKIIESKKKLK
jgi:hypothetical protein